MSRIEPIAVKQHEAAKMCSVSDRTFRQWEKDGRISGTKVGGVKLYPVERLRELVGASNGISR